MAGQHVDVLVGGIARSGPWLEPFWMYSVGVCMWHWWDSFIITTNSFYGKAAYLCPCVSCISSWPSTGQNGSGWMVPQLLGPLGYGPWWLWCSYSHLDFLLACSFAILMPQLPFAWVIIVHHPLTALVQYTAPGINPGDLHEISMPMTYLHTLSNSYSEYTCTVPVHVLSS